VTAYLDKVSPTYRASAHELAWKSFAWFVSEPDCLLHMRESGIQANLASLLWQPWPSVPSFGPYPDQIPVYDMDPGLFALSSFLIV
jgi:hypothetical protein